MRFTLKPGLIGYSQLFTAHGSPKRIRTVIDNNFIKRKQIFLWEIIFVIYTILLVVYIILFKIAKFVWNDILRKRFLIGYKEKRKLERIRFKSASIQIGTIVNGKEVFIADGELENINEDAFLIKTKHKIEKENTLFKLTTQYKNKFRKNSKQKVALCNGKIYKEIETNDNYFKYYYVIKYIPNSSLNYYYIYQYFLKESML
jgi:hypothetical protein